ncbi:uncharacterized protein [Arachis hypogaea]|uniref:uncharacterized protein n=1 Tax=Arachis hypogaea TaxID=3818 RepID=UPI003B22056E
MRAILMEQDFIDKKKQQRVEPQTIKRDRTRRITWKPPPLNWVKINVDAAYNKSTGSGAISAAVRDHREKLITDSAVRIKASSALAAEAMAVMNALIISKNMQMERVIIETDSLTLTQAVKSKGNIGEIQPILQDINLLMENSDKCGMTWVPREGNVLAHSIANLAAANNLGSRWCLEPPETVKMILNREVIRVSPTIKEQSTRIYASNLETEVNRKGESKSGNQGLVGR